MPSPPLTPMEEAQKASKSHSVLILYNFVLLQVGCQKFFSECDMSSGVFVLLFL